MITISTLQSQIALNRNILGYLEESTKNIKEDIIDTKEHNKRFPKIAGTSCVRLEALYAEMSFVKKNIGKCAKLQRALKSELSHRIMYNREMRSNNMEQHQLK